MNSFQTGVLIAVIIVLVIVISIVVVIAIIGIHTGKKLDRISNNHVEQTTQTAHVDYNKVQAEKFGLKGEIRVAKHLSEIIHKYGGFIFNDFCFEDDDGFSSEIDHILMTKGGLFIIETKANKGTIFGDVNADEWLCVKKEYQEDKYFSNPINQNKVHINHLRKMLKNVCPKMISMVVFPSADLSNIDIEGVYNMKSAINFIETTTEKNTKYTHDFIMKTHANLKNIKNIYGISKERHVQNIKRNHEA